MRKQRMKEVSIGSGTSFWMKLGPVAAALGAIIALIFGGLQYNINRELMKMNKVVAVIAVVDDENSGELMVRNTGTLNLYFAGFAIKGGKEWAFQQPRLIAANASGDPGYPIRPGKEVLDVILKSGSTTLILFLKDDLGRQWVSEHGIFMAKEKGSSFAWICSYGTYGESWELKLPESQFGAQNAAEYQEGAHFERGVRLRY